MLLQRRDRGMTPEVLRVRGAELALFHLDGDSAAGSVELIWAHGWGHTHANMLPLAQAMRRSTRSILIDFPGFGASPLPPAPCRSEERRVGKECRSRWSP